MAFESPMATSPSSMAGTWPKQFMRRNSGRLCSPARKSTSTSSWGSPSRDRNNWTRCEWPDSAMRWSLMGCAGWLEVMAGLLEKKPGLCLLRNPE
jgi:hypothetical protein